MDIHSSLKKLPSVESILEDERIAGRISIFSKKGITRIVRETIGEYRERLRTGAITASDADSIRSDIVARVIDALDAIEADEQRRIINATGVILHTPSRDERTAGYLAFL